MDYKNFNIEKFKNILYNVTIVSVIIFAFYIRTKLYLFCNYLGDDECRVAIGLIGRSIWDIFKPIGPLSSTPIFIFISKIIAEISNYNEYALKFLPYIFSISSLFLFYKISKEYLKKGVSICLAMFLLAVNRSEIYFSSIFKTYSLELFITLLCIYYFPKIDISKMNKGHLIILSVAIAILPLITLPSLYFIAIFFLISMWKVYKTKSSYIPIIQIIFPFLIVFIFYYFLTLAPTKELQLASYPKLWSTLLSVPLIPTLAMIIKFLNVPNEATLCTVFLLFGFIIYFIFNKNEHIEINFYILLGFIFAISSSCFGLYPLGLGRTSLFLLPVIILMIVKLFDSLKPQKFLFYVVSFLIFASYYKYFTFDYIKQINDVIPTFRNYAPKTLMQDLKTKYNSGYIGKVITTESSVYCYQFYAYKENFDPEDADMLWFFAQKEQVYNYLNKLDNKNNYWFYLVKDYQTEQARKYILDWLGNQNIIYKRQDNDSYLYFIRGVKPIL